MIKKVSRCIIYQAVIQSMAQIHHFWEFADKKMELRKGRTFHVIATDVENGYVFYSASTIGAAYLREIIDSLKQTKKECGSFLLTFEEEVPASSRRYRSYLRS